jgi:uncharacterized protein YprB with RNaseH-like and TPR domain
MLKRTYIHLPGVGRRTEAHFWRQGLGSWEDFLSAPRLPGFSGERFRRLKEQLRESLEQVANASYFARRLQPGEHWRLFRHLRPRAAYLDIETTGTFWPGLQVTVVGLYDGREMRQFVHGYNLQEFPRALEGLDLLVTFNGTQFDLPVLKSYFPDLVLPPVHVDLRFLLARLGFRGGLKKIEPSFGIHRPPEVNGMDGYMAVILWNRYQRGDRTSLDLLLKYNREDVINLEVLMEEGFRLYRERLVGLRPAAGAVSQPASLPESRH